MADNERKTIQYRIEFPASPTLPDPREFSCASECIQHVIDHCGLADKAICIEAGIKPSVFSQKKEAVNTHFTDDEYERVAKAIKRLGRPEWGDLALKYYAAQLLPAPTEKEKVFVELEAIERRRAMLLDRLKRL